MKDFYKPDFTKMKGLYIVMSRRGNGKTIAYYWIAFRKAYAKERKKLMGELIIILSITLILTVVSSFWIGYSYGKLRAIKLYEETQIQTFKDYMEGDTDNDSIN